MTSGSRFLFCSCRTLSLQTWQTLSCCHGASIPVTNAKSRKLHAIARHGFSKAVTTMLLYNKMFIHTTLRHQAGRVNITDKSWVHGTSFWGLWSVWGIFDIRKKTVTIPTTTTDPGKTEFDAPIIMTYKGGPNLHPCKVYQSTWYFTW